jgi:hypothetical protein
MVKVDVKDKLTANHVTGNTQGEQKYNSTRLMGGGGSQRHAPAALSPSKRPGID